MSGTESSTKCDIAMFADLDTRPARDASVVHSSFGRLRFHLPHWSGEGADGLVEALRNLAGVTHAEANPVTSNALILFEPRQTSAADLLAALPALRLATQTERAAVPLEGSESVAAGPTLIEVAAESLEAGTYVTGWWRLAYQGLGWASVGGAIVGAILPGIPTAPFVVLAGYFFIRSSPEAHRWLRNSRWFGPILRDWEDHRAIRRSVRNVALALVVFSMILISLLGLPTWLWATTIALQTLGLAVVLSLRVIDVPASEPTPAI
jgi:uncharacterized membrane protein YbaN (DUF454 family)